MSTVVEVPLQKSQHHRYFKKCKVLQICIYA